MLAVHRRPPSVGQTVASVGRNSPTGVGLSGWQRGCPHPVDMPVEGDLVATPGPDGAFSRLLHQRSPEDFCGPRALRGVEEFGLIELHRPLRLGLGRVSEISEDLQELGRVPCAVDGDRLESPIWVVLDGETFPHVHDPTPTHRQIPSVGDQLHVVPPAILQRSRCR